jgi:diketogulonate reductase-like aldo/keto reductase
LRRYAKGGGTGRAKAKAAVTAAAAAHGKTTAQVWFRWVQSVGAATLSGTTDPEHMVRRCQLNR